MEQGAQGGIAFALVEFFLSRFRDQRPEVSRDGGVDYALRSVMTNLDDDKAKALRSGYDIGFPARKGSRGHWHVFATRMCVACRPRGIRAAWFKRFRSWHGFPYTMGSSCSPETALPGMFLFWPRVGPFQRNTVGMSGRPPVVPLAWAQDEGGDGMPARQGSAVRAESWRITPPRRSGVIVSPARTQWRPW